MIYYICWHHLNQSRTVNVKFDWANLDASALSVGNILHLVALLLCSILEAVTVCDELRQVGG